MPTCTTTEVAGEVATNLKKELTLATFKAGQANPVVPPRWQTKDRVWEIPTAKAISADR